MCQNREQGDPPNLLELELYTDSVFWYEPFGIFSVFTIDRNCDVLPIVEYSIETDDRQTLNWDMYQFILIEEETPSEGQRMVSGNRSSGLLGIYLGESLERKC